MKEILRKLLSFEGDGAQAVDRERNLRVATAVLLIEVCRADFAVQPEEGARLRQLLADRFDLDDAELDALLDEAESEADRLVSLQHITRQLNEHCSQADKRRVIEMMWEVVFADGVKDHYEEHLIRQVAELLYVSHADFIQARHRAEPSG